MGEGRGKGYGTGSPIAFMCPAEREERRVRYLIGREHRVSVTGRTKRYRAPKYSRLGARSTTISREYVCSCGHVGWSNHVDLSRRAVPVEGKP